MNTVAKELLEIAKTLDSLKSEFELAKITGPLQKLQDASTKIAKSWSGSWLGYHSRIYYRDFQVPPAGAHFSQEWGLMPVGDTTGDWMEYSFDDVRRIIFELAGSPDLKLVKDLAGKATEVIDDKRSEIDSLLSTALEQRSDSFLEKLKNSSEGVEIVVESDFVKYAVPSGNLISRDTTAIGQGFRTPPHISVMAEVVALESPAKACGTLAKLAKQAAAHLAKRQRGETPKKGSLQALEPGLTPTDLRWPDKITFSWLHHHVPVKVWGTLLGLIGAAFIGGVTLGQTTFVRELFGKETPPPITSSERPNISSEDLKARVDQLIQGHNESIKNLYVAISNEEEAAGRQHFLSDQQPHIDASERLRATLKQENERFDQQLKALRELKH